MEYRYRKTSYRCSDCKQSFDKIRKFPVSKYPHGTDLPLPMKDPDCPECKKAKRVSFKSSVTDKTHPHINPDSSEAQNPIRNFSMGKSNFTKAMDATAEIVMKDYGLTNLNDHLREGDSMAPKLRPELERQVDDVFKPQKPIMGQNNSAVSINKALTAQINSGRYANQSQIRDIAAQAKDYGQNQAATTGYKVPTQIVHEYQKERPN